MLHWQRQLERGIAGLTNPSRNNASHSGRGAASVVISSILAVTLLTATLASAADATKSQPTSQSAPKNPQFPPVDERLQAPEIDWNRLISLHGKVLGPDDRPVAGARFYLCTD